MMCRLSQEAIDEILRSGRIYEVGGAVRDRFLKTRKIKDRDYLVTGIPYDNLTRILTNYGRVDLVGKSFGVIKFTQFRSGTQRTFDIALPRKEHSTGLAHTDFHVDFDPNMPIEEDLYRRDFTVNAMAVALDSDDLIDPLGGLVDLKKRQLRMTSADSFPDDPLRMLRAVQFAARYDFGIEPETFKAMRRHAALIHNVSSERVAEELNKLLLRSPRPSEGFRIMQTTGLLKEIMPELELCVGVDQPGGFHKYDVFEHTMYVVDASNPELRLRLAALFHDVTKPQHRRVVENGATFWGHDITSARTARQIMTRLRYSRELTNQVTTLVERHMFTTDVTDKGRRRLIKRVGPDLIFDLLNLRRADVEGLGMSNPTDDVDRFEAEIRAELDRKPPFRCADLALDGRDIMRLFDLPQGKAVGLILDHLLEAALDDPQCNTVERLESIAKEYVTENKDMIIAANDKEPDQ
jgi:putative nucleotidyltransferase with HDIG domain